MKKFTNISTEPLGILDGFPIKPCMKSGFCCTKAPCGYGEWNENKTACKYLDEPNEIGQRDCLRYEWIIENVPESIRNIHPAFGQGCCMPLGNTLRNKIIENIKSHEEDEKIRSKV